VSIVKRVSSHLTRLAARLPLSRPIQRAGANAFWLIFYQALVVLLGGVVGLFVVRYLGPSQYGDLSFAQSLSFMVGALVNLGLDMVVVRELAARPDDRPRILGTTFVLRLMGCCLGALLVVGLGVVLRPETPGNLALLSVTGLCLLPQAALVAEFWFTAQLRSRVSVAARLTGTIMALVVRVGLILLGASTVWIASTPFIEGAVAGLLLVYFYRLATDKRAIDWVFSRTEASLLARESAPVLLAYAFWACYKRVDQVFLDHFHGPEAVGLYAAPLQLIDMISYLPYALMFSVLPGLVELRQQNKALYDRRVQQFHDLATWTGLALAVVLSLGSGLLVRALFGASFQPAATVLALLAWNLLFIFQVVAQNQWCYAEKLQGYFPAMYGMAAAVNVVLNFLLVAPFGTTGAAVASLISQATLVFVAPAFFRATRPCVLHIGFALLAPVRYAWRYSACAESKSSRAPEKEASSHAND
jgi:O-antigen/teichoic acid export membrane protein